MRAAGRRQVLTVSGHSGMVREHQTSDAQSRMGKSPHTGFYAEPVIGPAIGRDRGHRPGMTGPRAIPIDSYVLLPVDRPHGERRAGARRRHHRRAGARRGVRPPVAADRAGAGLRRPGAEETTVPGAAGGSRQRVLPARPASASSPRSLRDRMVRTGYVAHAGGDVRNAKLGSLVHRPAAFCTPETTVADAARTMADADVSCVLVRLGDQFGLLTDSDIRARLVARGRGLRHPGQRADDRPPALTFAADRLAIDAMIDMLDLGIHHLPVLDSDGMPMGIVTATDLLYLEGRTPFGLRRSISKADTADQVVEAASHLPQTIVALIRAGVSGGGRLPGPGACRRHATMRLMELAFQRHGAAPCSWAWMALGTSPAARSRWPPTRTTRSPTPTPAETRRRLLRDGRGRVNYGLWTCGFGDDNSDVVARNPPGGRAAASGAGVRGLPGAARPLPPRAGRGRVRLPPRLAAAWRSSSRSSRSSAPPPPSGLRRSAWPARRPTSRRRWDSAAA